MRFKGKRQALTTMIATSFLIALMVEPVGAAQNRPILVISDYTTTPKEVAPGATFSLKLTLKNEGRYRAKQLLLTLASGNTSAGGPSITAGGQAGVAADTAGSGSGTAAPISVLGSGNVRYIGDISAGATEAVTFKLISSGNADPRAYNLNFGLEYVNAANGRDESAQQSIGLPLIRDAGLKLVELSTSKKIVIGKSFKVKGEVINSGSFTVHGIAIGTAGDGIEIVHAADFIGPLDGGDSDGFEITARPQSAKAREVAVTVTYRDDYNQERALTEMIEISPQAAAVEKDAPEKSGGVFAAISRFFRALLGIGSGE